MKEERRGRERDAWSTLGVTDHLHEKCVRDVWSSIALSDHLHLSERETSQKERIVYHIVHEVGEHDHAKHAKREGQEGGQGRGVAHPLLRLAEPPQENEQPENVRHCVCVEGVGRCGCVGRCICASSARTQE